MPRAKFLKIRPLEIKSGALPGGNIVLNSDLSCMGLEPLKAPAARVENFENEASQNQIGGGGHFQVLILFRQLF